MLKKRKKSINIAKNAAVIYLYTDCDIEYPEGTVQPEGDMTTLILKYKDQWERRSITCKINSY